MSKLIAVLIGIVVICVLVWVVNTVIPPSPPFWRWIGEAVVAIVALIWGARLLGVNIEG